MIMNEEKGAPVHKYRNLYKHKRGKNMKMIKVLPVFLSRSLKSSM